MSSKYLFSELLPLSSREYGKSVLLYVTELDLYVRENNITGVDLTNLRHKTREFYEKGTHFWIMYHMIHHQICFS